MRLLEAIIAANHAATEGRKGEVHLHEFTDELPLAALTCIDPRLNKLFPGVLGLTDDQFIWLRNAGNIITTSTSSTVRSIALSIFVKGAKEVVVIGHTDCKISMLSLMDLLARLQERGIDRSLLGEDNLHRLFGLFSSENQNVINSVGHLRQSPFIPPKMPVHGLLINTDTGRLEWVVNGYDAPPVSAVASPATPSKIGAVANAFESLLGMAQPLIAQKWEAVTKQIGAESAPAATARPAPTAKPAAVPAPPPIPPTSDGRSRLPVPPRRSDRGSYR